MGQPMQGSMRFDHARCSLGVGNCPGQVPAGVERPGTPCRTGGAQPDVQRLRVGVEVRQEPDAACGLEDNALTVRGRVADVETFEVGVPAEIPALRGDRVQVAVAFVVGEEGDASVDPHGVGEVAVQFRHQAFKFPAAVRVDPQLAGGAAAVALPPGLFAREHAADHQGPFVSDGRAFSQRLHRPVGKLDRRAAVQGNGEGPAQPGVLLFHRAGGDDLAGGIESLHPGALAAPEGQLAEVPAVDVRSNDFRSAALHHLPGKPGAVGRELRAPCRQLHGGYPPCPATGHRGHPDIIFRHESDKVAVQIGVTKVSSWTHGSILSFAPLLSV